MKHQDETGGSSPDSGATLRTKVRQVSKRGAYDRETVYRIIDESLVCHVGFVDDGQPYVVPTLHVRLGDVLYFHGSRKSRMLRIMEKGAPVCATMTLLDGLVLARSAFHHSVNYRSVMVFGKGSPIEDAAEKLSILDALVEHVIKGRSDDARPPTKNELAGTHVVALPITEASAKLREGPPVDDDADYALPVWAGVLPMRMKTGEPIADPKLAENIALPNYLRAYSR